METLRNCSVRKIPEAIKAIRLCIGLQRTVIFIGREILPEPVKNFLSLVLLVCIVINTHSAISVLLDISQGT